MKPTWTSDCGTVKLWLGDCLEVMPSWPDELEIVSDPPFGMNYSPDKSSDTDTNRSARKWKPIHGDCKPFDPLPMMRFAHAILWGANWFGSQLPATGGWLVFNKRGEGRPSGNDYGDCEIAWSNVTGAVRMFSHMWHGAFRWQSEPVLHPNQKPVALMEWCIGFTKGAIADPYMGSGTTGVAAVRLGREFYGCEIDPEYFEVSKQRIIDELNRFPLLENVETKPTQTTIFDD